MVDVLGPLPARPPTPPRTASRMLSEKDRTEDSPVTVQTPIDSHFLHNDSTGAPSSRQSKRVNFSPWPKFIKPPSFTNTKSKAPPPASDRKPTRSILKATNSPGPVIAEIISYTPESFAMLLESITQQLAGESTSSRVDAYMQFFGALRAYEKLPTEEEIVRKLGLITQFIQRDINRDPTKGSPLDTNLVIQALKLSVVLVWHSQIAPQLPDDFRLFLVEHSISCLESGNLPKSVMTHYLSVLSTQKFQAKLMTASRITRLLEMLHNLTDKVKGNSVASQRLLIYEHLFELSKSGFIAQTALWMDHLVSGLLHQIKDIRLKALELGFNIYMASGSNPTLSKTLRDMFDRPLGNNRKLVSEICERMSRMMASPETGEHIPQIWGVITLLLRTKRFSIDLWPHFREWVLVLQKCFNCSDIEIKSKAIVNWNRFILVVNINDTTSRSLLKMLIKPLLSQFERKKHDKQGSQPSQLVVASYYNLLYYAFRPDASHQQLDMVWGEYIAAPSSNIFMLVPSLSDRVSHALSYMLWNSHSLKQWSENRCNEPGRIGAEELPPLDCKWVRSRTPAVLKVFEDILKSSVWVSEMEQSNIAVAWGNLSYALAFAASKEITPSPESMQTVAHVLGLLQRVWNAGPASLNAEGETSRDTFFERFRFLSTTMITALGSIPFTEKLLLKTADSTYQSSNTPTHRHSKANNNPDSPILHLLRLVSDAPGISEPSAAYTRLIDGIVEAACHGKVSRGSRLDTLRQCATVNPGGPGSPSGGYDFTQSIWRSAAQLSADCLSSFPSDPARERDGSVSRDYLNVVQTLSAGLDFSNHSVWDELLGAFIRVLRTEKGDSAIPATLLEPLANLLLNRDVGYAYFPASLIFKQSFCIAFSGYDQEEFNGHQIAVAPAFPTTLYTLAERILRVSYDRRETLPLDNVATFIGSIVSFFATGTLPVAPMFLYKLQGPLGLYLKDPSRKLAAENSIESGAVITRALTTAVLGALQSLPHDAFTLQRFEQIICSGLESSQTPTANRFRDFCLSTFGIQQSLSYPIRISQALQNPDSRVRSQTPSLLPPNYLQVDPGQLSKHNPEAQHCESGKSSSRPATENVNIAAENLPTNLDIALVTKDPLEASPLHTVLPFVPAGSEHAATKLQQTEPTPQQAEEDTFQHPSIGENPVPSFAKHDTKRHSEVFSMIANLRSSSPPATTPRDIGFMTPPHLHSLRNEQFDVETPQTPTLPALAADNEDGFLGSSPTPAIRGRTASEASAIPPSFTTGADAMDIDPPSSPPEHESHITSSRQGTPVPATYEGSEKNRKKRASAKQKKQPRKKGASAASTPKPAEKTDENEVQQTLKSRLRSSDKTAAAQEEQDAPKTVTDETENGHVAGSALRTGNGTNASPRKAQNPLLERVDLALDSSSEDTDTQATSQLEHDLVSAVDLGSDAADKEIADSLDTAMVTRKRKREEIEASTPAKKDPRRSSRFSSSAPVVETEDSQTTHSKKQKVATRSQGTASPAPTTLKNLQQETGAFAESPKREKAKNKGTEKQTETQESSQKRRSGRISGVPAPDIPEDIPAPKRSPRPSSSQKRNKRKERKAAKRRSKASGGAENVTDAEESPKKSDGHLQIPDAENMEQELEATSPLQLTELESEVHLDQENEALDGSEDVLMTEVQETAQSETVAVQETIAPLQRLEEATDDHGPLMAAQSRPLPALEEPEQQPEQRPELEQQPEPATASQPGKNSEIKTSLRTLLDQVKLSSLDRDTVKEMDDLLFDLRVEMHEALRRHRDTTASTTSQ
ncbi:Rap1-interacting factor 1 N terminal-domain-containing protein [Aspergillus crustosus]